MQKKNDFPALKPIISNPWARPTEDILASLESDPRRGISSEEAGRRTGRFGPNILRQVKPQSSLVILSNQFKNIIVYFLIAAAALSFVLGDNVEGFAIVAVIIINAAIGFGTELKGVRSIEALRRLGTVSSRVRRNGGMLRLSSPEA